LVPDFFELLREFNIAFVSADTAGKWPYAEDLTANFVYCRLHGDTQLYTSGYSDRALDWVGDATETVAQRTAAEGCETRYSQKKIRGARFIRLLRQRRESARPFRCSNACSENGMMWKFPNERTQKSKKLALVVSGSPAHKIISATSVDFGARPLAGQQWDFVARPVPV
jgi:hypothetical protein